MIRTRVFSSAIFAALLALLSAGCGDGLSRASVKGQILVDKEPLESGTINFFPVEGNQGPSAGVEVKKGEYFIPADKGVIVGKNRVELRGFRKSGRKIADAYDKTKMIDELVPAVRPDQFAKAPLIREIKPGDNTIDFDVEGLKK